MRQHKECRPCAPMCVAKPGQLAVLLRKRPTVCRYKCTPPSHMRSVNNTVCRSQPGSAKGSARCCACVTSRTIMGELEALHTFYFYCGKTLCLATDERNYHLGICFFFPSGVLPRSGTARVQCRTIELLAVMAKFRIALCIIINLSSHLISEDFPLQVTEFESEMSDPNNTSRMCPFFRAGSC